MSRARIVRPLLLLAVLAGIVAWALLSRPGSLLSLPTGTPTASSKVLPPVSVKEVPATCDGIPLPCIPDPPHASVAGSGWTPTDDGPDGVIRVKENARLLLSRQRFTDLTALIDRYATLKWRLDDGRFKLVVIDSFFDEVFSGPSIDGADLPSLLIQWTAASPDSAATAIATAAAWRNAAWRARGSGFSDTVTPEGWRLFHERLMRAVDVLDKSEPYASKNPLWYLEYLQLSLSLGQPMDQQLAVYRRGTAAFPEFWPLHFQMMVSLLPQWNGSSKAQAAFIEQVLLDSPQQARPELYARLWWAVNQLNKEDIFVAMGASWPRMKAGFESLEKQFPSSRWNRSSYAMFACDAGDMSTYTRLRAQLGPRIFTSAFPSNLSLDVCDARAAAKRT